MVTYYYVYLLVNLGTMNIIRLTLLVLLLPALLIFILRNRYNIRIQTSLGASFSFNAFEVGYYVSLSPICVWTAGRRQPGAATGNRKQTRK